jgi:hypothetical protein
VLTDIADAVVAELNAAAKPVADQPPPEGGYIFDHAFTAERTYLPVFDLAEMKDLHVTVVPKGLSTSPFGRGSSQSDYALDIGVQKKLSGTAAADIDPLMALVETIGRFFRQRRLASYPEAVWVRTEHPHLYAPEHLSELRQFTSVLTLTFRVIA